MYRDLPSTPISQDPAKGMKLRDSSAVRAMPALVTYAGNGAIRGGLEIGEENHDTYSLATRTVIIFGSCAAFWFTLGMLTF